MINVEVKGEKKGKKKRMVGRGVRLLLVPELGRLQGACFYGVDERRPDAVLLQDADPFDRRSGRRSDHVLQFARVLLCFQ